MEVRDLDQEYLESVLKDDDHDRNSELPPTSPARRTATPQHYTSIARGPNRGTESDTSRERYSLLPDYAQESFVTTNETVKNTSTDHSALLFQDLREDVEPNLPKNLVTPVTKRARDMVRMTAARCVSAPQFEVMLKVKQADNPEFAFLRTDNECHDYFIWLKQQEDRTRKEKETVAKSGGMDLLDMYSSSSDDEQDLPSDQKTAQSEPSREDIASTKPFNLSDVSQPTETSDGATKRINRDDEDEKKGKRLKRAKLMRGHYRLQLMEDSKPA
mmetsp:Transcript_16664/g.30149  ORF Transcript_16664/g.30149 Transcript_16664/m.30149 type:complete len:273 (-) Transcript_16664:43-861(-)